MQIRILLLLRIPNLLLPNLLIWLIIHTTKAGIGGIGADTNVEIIKGIVDVAEEVRTLRILRILRVLKLSTKQDDRCFWYLEKEYIKRKYRDYKKAINKAR